MIQDSFLWIALGILNHIPTHSGQIHKTIDI